MDTVNQGKAWHRLVADSLMAREGLLTRSWSYDYGVVFNGMIALHAQTGEEAYLRYIRESMDSFLEDGGRSIRDCDCATFNLDHINNGKILLFLYAQTGEAKYRAAADLLRAQLASHPRTPQGGFWHKLIYPQQMWLDGLYMAEPFYARYTVEFENGAALDDVARQFALIYEKTFDPATGLCRHAWDSACAQPWADKATGQSQHAWGRAMGWYMAALVDTLPFFPPEHPGHAQLRGILNRLADALYAAQDRPSHTWNQVLDARERPGNYLESSCSALFTYAFLKGARLGFLPAEYRDRGREAFEGLVTQFIQWVNGQPIVTKCCQVGGLGGDAHREGTFAYYLSEPIIANDLKGTGAFILAACERALLDA